MTLIRTLLIANRGDAALRVIRTCERLGLRSVVTFAPDDRDALHVQRADAAVRVPSYLDVDAAVAAAVTVGADALHPGWGFLAESADLAEACAAAGVTFVGPRPETIRLLGNKITAKEAMAAAGVPTLDGEGWPRIVKAAAGGGGRGMRIVEQEGDLEAALASASREAEAAFGDGTVFTERYLPKVRHVEVQVLGDAQGRPIPLGERECSIQRRHQKLVEETPSPGITDDVRRRLRRAAMDGAAAVGYVGAGTFEFLVDGDDIAFLEVNTRLQVEHGITEQVLHDHDLVAEQLHIAAGEPAGFHPPREEGDDHPLLGVITRGHAIEVRIVAEVPSKGWAPSGGEVVTWEHAEMPHVRWDESVSAGSTVSAAYDSLLAKVMAWSPHRPEAIERLRVALRSLRVHGPETNLRMLLATLDHPAFRAGDTTTAFLDEHPEVLDPGVDPALTSRRLLAATVHSAAVRRATATVQAFVPAGYRNVPAVPLTTTWLVGDDPVTVAYAHDGSWRVAGDTVHVDRDDLVTRHRVVVRGDRTFVDDLALVEVPRHPEPGGAAAGGGATAPVPGTVLAVHVTAGQDVDAGDALVTLEAMKMEHTISAPGAATVEAVLVAKGDQVDARQALVELVARQSN